MRKTGYYWVSCEDCWDVAFFDSVNENWIHPMFDVFYDDEDFDEIDEKIITR
jgi:hypothetical protein